MTSIVSVKPLALSPNHWCYKLILPRLRAKKVETDTLIATNIVCKGSIVLPDNLNITFNGTDDITTTGNIIGNNVVGNNVTGNVVTGGIANFSNSLYAGNINTIGTVNCTLLETGSVSSGSISCGGILYATNIRPTNGNTINIEENLTVTGPTGSTGKVTCNSLVSTNLDSGQVKTWNCIVGNTVSCSRIVSSSDLFCSGIAYQNQIRPNFPSSTVTMTANVSVTNSLTVSNSITASSATITTANIPTLTATNANLTNITTDTIAATGSITAASGTITTANIPTLTATDATLTNITTDTIAATGNITTTDSFFGFSISVDYVYVETSITTYHGYFNSLNTNSINSQTGIITTLTSTTADVTTLTSDTAHVTTGDVQDLTTETLKLTNAGLATADNILYYNTTNKEVTYGTLLPFTARTGYQPKIFCELKNKPSFEVKYVKLDIYATTGAYYLNGWDFKVFFKQGTIESTNTVVTFGSSAVPWTQTDVVGLNSASSSIPAGQFGKYKSWNTTSTTMTTGTNTTTLSDPHLYAVCSDSTIDFWKYNKPHLLLASIEFHIDESQMSVDSEFISGVYYRTLINEGIQSIVTGAPYLVPESSPPYAYNDLVTNEYVAHYKAPITDMRYLDYV